MEGFYLLRFHFRPVVVTWLHGCPTGIRPHQLPSIPVSTCNLCFPCRREGKGKERSLMSSEDVAARALLWLILLRINNTCQVDAA